MFTKYPILCNTISDFENYSVAAGKEKALTQVPNPRPAVQLRQMPTLPDERNKAADVIILSEHQEV